MGIELPVKKMVEFLLQEGSIDSRFTGFDRANEGSRIHRMLQKAGGENYQSEVALSIDWQVEELKFTLSGRADGIIREEEGVTVDEIKTTALPISSLREDFCSMHWAQALCYGHIIAQQEGLQVLQVRLTYYQIDTGDVVRYVRRCSAEQLREYFEDLLRQYLPWARLQLQWAETRDLSAQNLRFPFGAYRPGQRNMAIAVYRSIERSSRLLCQAPTGIGKTISALFPAVKALGEGKAQRIFYGTAKGVARQAAEQALEIMRQKGLRLRSLTLTAKDKICFLEKRNCTPEACPYARDYYQRSRQALFELLQEQDCLSREAIEEAAKKGQVCPFELSLDAALWCDCIICDYNYLFDPQAYLRRFFMGGGGENIFLIDEAHNLLQRAREMFSAKVSKSSFLDLRTLLSKEDKPVFQAAGKVSKWFAGLKKEGSESWEKAQEQPPEELADLLKKFCAGAETWMEAHPDSPKREDLLPAYFEARTFLQTLDLYDEHYCTLQWVYSREAICRLWCLDPAKLLDEALGRARSAVLFSATLSPLDYFARSLGCEEAGKVRFPSPFDEKKLLLLCADRVGLRYQEREESKEEVARLIHAMTLGKEGHYMAYFPSYKYMNQVFEVYSAFYPEEEVLLQSGGMSEEERQEFLSRFDQPGPLLGFCVLGGMYAEGIDLKGDRLIGSAIVGVGLPQVGFEQELLREYYEQTDGAGFAFAYQFPGMNKVLQAAGRVIRSSQDRGVVLLIDRRFSFGEYRRLFPEHWAHIGSVRGEEEVHFRVKTFWESCEEEEI